MIFSVSYKSKHIDSSAEIVIPCSQVGHMFKYIKEHQEKRYNIKVGDAYPSEDVRNFLSDKNHTFGCKKMEHVRALLAAGHKAYFDYPINSWEEDNKLPEMGDSDIYIDGHLCF